MPIAKRMRYRVKLAVLYMVDFPSLANSTGTTKVMAAPKKNASDPWKLMPTLSSLNNWQSDLE